MRGRLAVGVLVALAALAFVGGAMAQPDPDRSGESICPTDPEAEKAREAEARSADEVREGADIALRMTNQAFEIADHHWKARVGAFERTFAERAPELAVKPPPERWMSPWVRTDTCRLIAERDTGGCQDIPEWEERRWCMMATMSATTTLSVREPSDAWCDRLLTCPGACCRLLYYGDASGCEDATGTEALWCGRIATMRDDWVERCAPGGDGMECVSSLATLAHQHGSTVCEWPAARLGEDVRMASVRDACYAVIEGQPDRCWPTPVPEDEAPPYRAVLDSLLFAQSGTTWWLAAAMGSLPSVCAVEAEVREPGRPSVTLQRVVFTRGEGVPGFLRARVGREHHATRSSVTTRGACAMTITW